MDIGKELLVSITAILNTVFVLIVFFEARNLFRYAARWGEKAQSEPLIGKKDMAQS
jgi:hypothetical protein